MKLEYPRAIICNQWVAESSQGWSQNQPNTRRDVFGSLWNLSEIKFGMLVISRITCLYIFMRESLSTFICHQHPERRAFQDKPYNLYGGFFPSEVSCVSINLHATLTWNTKENIKLQVEGIKCSLVSWLDVRSWHPMFSVHLEADFLLNHSQSHVRYGQKVLIFRAGCMGFLSLGLTQTWQTQA